MCKQFDTYLKLSVFCAVKQITIYIYILKTALFLLDTAMYRHVAILLHVSAFFVHLQHVLSEENYYTCSHHHHNHHHHVHEGLGVFPVP